MRPRRRSKHRRAWVPPRTGLRAAVGRGLHHTPLMSSLSLPSPAAAQEQTPRQPPGVQPTVPRASLSPSHTQSAHAAPCAQPGTRAPPPAICLLVHIFGDWPRARQVGPLGEAHRGHQPSSHVARRGRWLGSWPNPWNGVEDLVPTGAKPVSEAPHRAAGTILGVGPGTGAGVTPPSQPRTAPGEGKSPSL